MYSSKFEQQTRIGIHKQPFTIYKTYKKHQNNIANQLECF